VVAENINEWKNGSQVVGVHIPYLLKAGDNYAIKTRKTLLEIIAIF
jgi:hypothetical protein